MRNLSSEIGNFSEINDTSHVRFRFWGHNTYFDLIRIEFSNTFLLLKHYWILFIWYLLLISDEIFHEKTHKPQAKQEMSCQYDEWKWANSTSYGMTVATYWATVFDIWIEHNLWFFRLLYWNELPLNINRANFIFH